MGKFAEKAGAIASLLYGRKKLPRDWQTCYVCGEDITETDEIELTRDRGALPKGMTEAEFAVAEADVLQRLLGTPKTTSLPNYNERAAHKGCLRRG